MGDSKKTSDHVIGSFLWAIHHTSLFRYFADQFAFVFDFQFGVNIFDMSFHCVFAQIQFIGNHFIGQPFQQTRNDLVFTFGQILNEWNICTSVRLAMQGFGKKNRKNIFGSMTKVIQTMVSAIRKI